MFSLPEVFPEASETPGIPKAFTLQCKTRQISRRRRYFEPEEFSVPIKSLPVDICLIINTFLNELSLVFYILREKGRMVTDHDVVPGLGPTLQFHLKREEGGRQILPLAYFQSSSQSECAKQTDHPQTATNNNHLFFRGSYLLFHPRQVIKNCDLFHITGAL